jgi:hypothetical protein
MERLFRKLRVNPLFCLLASAPIRMEDFALRPRKRIDIRISIHQYHSVSLTEAPFAFRLLILLN